MATRYKWLTPNNFSPIILIFLYQITTACCTAQRTSAERCMHSPTLFSFCKLVPSHLLTVTRHISDVWQCLRSESTSTKDPISGGDNLFELNASFWQKCESASRNCQQWEGTSRHILQILSNISYMSASHLQHRLIPFAGGRCVMHNVAECCWANEIVCKT